ncbi:MAG: methyl-accepting chemotaxis protein [Halodesulfurarchaeum sp.]
MSTTDQTSLLQRYERLLWGVMDRLGVTRSVERKMLTATLLQFGAIVTIFVLGVVLLGVDAFVRMFSPAEMAAFGVVFVLAVAALLNTLLILQRDFVTPIKRMQEAAEHIAAGDLDSGVPETDQTDEIGELAHSFAEMHGYLETVAAQADALSREEFDADVLDQEVPGDFGDALSTMEETLRTRIETLETKRAEIEARNEELTTAAEAYTQVLSAVADGDLTRRLEADVEHEAMAEIGLAVNDMLAEFEGMIADLLEFAGRVATESQEVRTSAEEVKTASEDISQSVQEISAGVDQESRRLDEVTDEAENLSATIEEITASAENVAELTARTADVGSSGQEAAEDAIDEMGAIRERTRSAVEAVDQLNDSLAEIGDITDVILDIADQTNILALNAGIEAARVDSGGDGFAVVAEEVKSLAAETKESAEDIEALIDEVQDRSARTVSEMEEMATRVEAGTETVEAATEAFERMAENVADIDAAITEVNQATAEQAESTQDVVAMIEDIAAISDQTAAESQTVAAAAEEQAATLNGVAENTARLAESATELESELGTFEVESAVGAPGSEGTPEGTRMAGDGGSRDASGFEFGQHGEGGGGHEASERDHIEETATDP